MTVEEHKQHLQHQKVITLAIVLSLIATNALPQFHGICAGLELGACLTWLWLD